MTTKKLNTFEQLSVVNVNGKTEQLKSGNTTLTYLSWAHAWAEIKTIDETASYQIHEFPMFINGQVIEGVTVPYLWTPNGYFVKVSVTINGRTETETLPVMDEKNVPMGTKAPVWKKSGNGGKAQKVWEQQPEPTTFEINKSHKRCLVKAIALHGLGLYLYQGEDIPKDTSVSQTKEAEERAKQEAEERQNLIQFISEQRKLRPEVEEAVKKIESHKNINAAIENMPMNFLRKTFDTVNFTLAELDKAQKESAASESK